MMISKDTAIMDALINSLRKSLFVGLALLCLPTVSRAVIILDDQASNDLSADASWTMLRWADLGGFRRTWDINDSLRDPGVNDTFRIVVPLGMTGIVEVADLGWDNDRYSLIDVTNGTIGLTSMPANQVLTDAITNGIPPNTITQETSPSVTFANTDNGGSSNWSTGAFDFTTPDTYDLNLDWVDIGLDPASTGGVGVRFRTIPEPSAALLLMMASALVALRRRRA